MLLKFVSWRVMMFSQTHHNAFWWSTLHLTLTWRRKRYYKLLNLLCMICKNNTSENNNKIVQKTCKAHLVYKHKQITNFAIINKIGDHCKTITVMIVITIVTMMMVMTRKWMMTLSGKQINYCARQITSLTKHLNTINNNSNINNNNKSTLQII